MDSEDIHKSCAHAQIKKDLAKHCYSWISMLSHRPSLSLAIYEPNQYVVGVFQHHVTAIKDSGTLHHWKNVKSDYCLQRYDCFFEGVFRYLVTDPVVGGQVTSELELDEIDKWRPGSCRKEERVRDLAYHLLRALNDIHCSGFAHLNLQWSNVWLDRSHHALLGGFHNLTPLSMQEEAILGHPLFNPPEVLTMQNVDCSQQEMQLNGDGLIKVDMWALGVCVLEALTGCWVGSRSDFTHGANVATQLLLSDINEQLPCLPERMCARGITSHGIDFVVMLLQLDPLLRPTAADALQHPWMLERKVDEVDCCCLDATETLGLNDVTTCSVQYTHDGTGDPVTSKNLVEPPRGYGALDQQLRSFGYRLNKVTHQDQRGTWIIHAKTVVGGADVAIKRKLKRRSTRGERYHWPTLSHASILGVVDAFQAGPFLYFVTQWMDKGNLHASGRRAGSFGGIDCESFYRGAAASVLQALAYLHGRGLAHLNITWQHVLQDSRGQIKLTGFENVRGVRGQGPLRFGYLPLRAPECFRRDSAIRANLCKLDMWSLGAALLRALLCKSIAGEDFRSVYSYTNPDVTYRRILDNLVLLPDVLDRSRLSLNTQLFILRLLQFRPELRPSARESLLDQWVNPQIIVQDDRDAPIDVGVSMLDTVIGQVFNPNLPQQVPDNGTECETIATTPEMIGFGTPWTRRLSNTPQQRRLDALTETSQIAQARHAYGQSREQLTGADQQQPSPPHAQPSFCDHDTISGLVAQHMWKPGPRTEYPLQHRPGQHQMADPCCEPTCAVPASSPICSRPPQQLVPDPGCQPRDQPCIRQQLSYRSQQAQQRRQDALTQPSTGQCPDQQKLTYDCQPPPPQVQQSSCDREVVAQHMWKQEPCVGQPTTRVLPTFGQFQRQQVDPRCDTTCAVPAPSPVCPPPSQQLVPDSCCQLPAVVQQQIARVSPPSQQIETVVRLFDEPYCPRPDVAPPSCPCTPPEDALTCVLDPCVQPTVKDEFPSPTCRQQLITECWRNSDVTIHRYCDDSPTRKIRVKPDGRCTRPCIASKEKSDRTCVVPRSRPDRCARPVEAAVRPKECTDRHFVVTRSRLDQSTRPSVNPTIRKVVCQPAPNPRCQNFLLNSPLSCRPQLQISSRQHLAANCQVIEEPDPNQPADNSDPCCDPSAEQAVRHTNQMIR